ncbi:hypothetical protein N4T77_14155 [Clostridium sp. CX1]|uniref:hypothetical protein n=1 Tax=Clostridium sp. CX1 TaxID=2978346 RepID=UPI0021C0B244|nr:hypothetical protein [Clostridium sp. CX1]MCT8977740.1 hypothetical protein [Clostridium sp. CX1]
MKKQGKKTKNETRGEKENRRSKEARKAIMYNQSVISTNNKEYEESPNVPNGKNTNNSEENNSDKIRHDVMQKEDTCSTKVKDIATEQNKSKSLINLVCFVPASILIFAFIYVKIFIFRVILIICIVLLGITWILALKNKIKGNFCIIITLMGEVYTIMVVYICIVFIPIISYRIYEGRFIFNGTKITSSISLCLFYIVRNFGEVLNIYISYQSACYLWSIIFVTLIFYNIDRINTKYFKFISLIEKYILRIKYEHDINRQKEFFSIEHSRILSYIFSAITYIIFNVSSEFGLNNELKNKLITTKSILDNNDIIALQFLGKPIKEALLTYIIIDTGVFIYKDWTKRPEYKEENDIFWILIIKPVSNILDKLDGSLKFLIFLLLLTLVYA